MDNLQEIVTTEQEAIDTYSCANKECENASMPLRSWNTNSSNVRNFVRQDNPDNDPTEAKCVMVGVGRYD